MITVCFGILALFFMPHTPRQAKFLTDEERVVALHRMKADSHGATDQEDVGQERFNWHWIRMALISPNTILCSLAWFFLLIPLYVRHYPEPGILADDRNRATVFFFQP
jgi:hypothetical protein